MKLKPSKEARWYLNLLLRNGYKFLATNEDGATYAYKNEPETKVKAHNGITEWYCSMKNERVRVMFSLGTSIDSSWPLNIEYLLNDTVDWHEVEPYTHVYVRNSNEEDWIKANFLRLETNGMFKVTLGDEWTDTNFESYKYCKLGEHI